MSLIVPMTTVDFMQVVSTGGHRACFGSAAGRNTRGDQVTATFNQDRSITVLYFCFIVSCKRFDKINEY